MKSGSGKYFASAGAVLILAGASYASPCGDRGGQSGQQRGNSRPMMNVRHSANPSMVNRSGERGSVCPSTGGRSDRPMMNRGPQQTRGPQQAHVNTGRSGQNRGSECQKENGHSNQNRGNTGNSPREVGDNPTRGNTTRGNNGVGNGEDAAPPGNPPENDGAGTSPGNPGNRR